MFALVRRSWSDVMVPAAIGLAAFAVTPGFAVVSPTNIAWLQQGDLATNYIGWEFYRSAPWTLPLGLNPDFGPGLGTSIVYSDSIPGLAIPAKLLGPLLPHPFQYLGLWLLLCWVAQAVAGWNLLALFTQRPAVRALGTAFFVTAPVLLWRTDAVVAHAALCGQFLILLGLHLSLRPGDDHRWLRWTLLLNAALLVHAYIATMLLALWAADLMARRGHGHQPQLRRVAAIAASLIGTAWMTGYFTAGRSTGADGFGTYSASPLAFFDPGNRQLPSWSRLLPDLPGGSVHVEGMNFLGLGVIVLLVIALLWARQVGFDIDAHLRRRRHLIAATVALAALALSNAIGFDDAVLHIPLPGVVEAALSTFRASGRMAWPLYYLVVVFAIWLLNRVASRAAVAVLAICLIIQLVDTAPGWGHARESIAVPAASQWRSSLTDPFWRQASHCYTDVELLYPRSVSIGWRDIAQYAYDHGMRTGVVYVSRVDHSALVRENQRLHRQVALGRFTPTSLYIVLPQYETEVATAAQRGHALLRHINGYVVLAPQAAKCRAR